MQLGQPFGGDAAKGIDVPVDDAFAAGTAQCLGGECRAVSFFGKAVEDGAQKAVVDVVGLPHFFERVAGATCCTAIGSWWQRIATVEVQSAHGKGVGQFEVVVQNEARMVFLGYLVQEGGDFVGQISRFAYVHLVKAAFEQESYQVGLPVKYRFGCNAY